MIQAIVFALIAIWLTWGIVNVVWGLGQILWGIICSLAAIGLYALAYILELVGYIVRKLS